MFRLRDFTSLANINLVGSFPTLSLEHVGLLGHRPRGTFGLWSRGFFGGVSPANEYGFAVRKNNDGTDTFRGTMYSLRHSKDRFCHNGNSLNVELK
jgi:hypothetical protein